MSERLLWFKGNRNPSISENLVYADGTPIDLSDKTVQFKMRAVNSSALKVDQPAIEVNPPGTDGLVRYDWAAIDVDTEGDFLVWWEVTQAGRVQSYREAIIEIREHAPLDDSYVEMEELKATTSMQDTSFADRDLMDGLVAASRAVDEITGRRFYADADAAQVRLYVPDLTDLEDELWIDDLLQLTSVTVDRDGDGTFEETWVQGTDFRLEPLNAPAEGEPWESIKILNNTSSFGLFDDTEDMVVKVTGKFGRTSAPAGVKIAVKIIATKFVQRKRQAPFGVIGLGRDGAAVHIAREDTEVMLALKPYMHRRMLIA